MAMPGQKNGSNSTPLAWLLLFVAFVLAACAFPTDSDAGKNDGQAESGLRPVTLQLKWFHQFQFAGYYAAREKGFYRRKGLDVAILEGGPFDTTEVVLSGEADFGVATSCLAIDRIEGDPLVVLASIFQYSPHVLIVRKHGEKEPTLFDLVGKKIQIAEGNRAAELHAMFLAKGIALERFRFEPLERSLRFEDQSIEAFSGYVCNEVFDCMKKGISFSLVHPRGYGVDFYGDCLFTSERQVDNSPELVEDFVSASLEGWRYALDHTEEIAELIVQQYGYRGSLEKLLFEAAEIRKLVAPGVVPIGHINERRWRFIADTYAKLGLCSQDRELEGFFFDPEKEMLERHEEWNVFACIFGGIILFLVVAICARNIFLIREVKKRTLELSEQIAAREAALAALEENERKFEAAFMSSPVAFAFSLTDECRYVEVSQGFEQFTGYSRDEVLGKTPVDVGVLADPEQRKRLLAKMEKDGFLENETIETRTAKAERKVGLLSTKPVEIGGETLILSQIVDVTDRVVAEETLRRSEEEYRIVADFTYDWEYWTGPRGDLKYCSPSCQRMTGYAAEDFVEKPELLLDIVHEDDRKKVARHVEAYGDMANMAPLEDFRIVSAEGLVRWISHKCLPVFSEDGTYLGRRISNREVTARKAVEQKLAASEAMFRAITEKSRDVLAILDENGVYKYVSPSVAVNAGLLPEEMVGKNAGDFIHESDLENIREDFRSALKRPGETFLSHEFRRKQPRAENAVFEARITNMLDDLAIEGVVVSTRNVTERRNLQNEIEQALKMEVIGSLAGGIAHDFNNILWCIVGHAELALEDVKRKRKPEKNINEILSAELRASVLTDRILEYSRRSCEGAVPVNVAVVAERALGLLRAAVPSSIKVSLKLDSEYSVMADPSKIQQIMLTLFSNAAEVMENKEDGFLELRVEDFELDEAFVGRFKTIKPGRCVMLMVSDNGPGISEDILDSIFEPGFTTKEETSGTGMGLSAVRDIVKSYGGAIAVESEPGKGAVFTVCMPAVMKDMRFFRDEGGFADAERDDGAVNGSEKIMVVDDEAMVASMTGESLKRFGYDVTICTNSENALSLFASAPEKFDLVVTDMVMPGMAGDQLTASMLAIRPDIPVVVCTGFGKMIEGRKASDIGAKAIVYKPIVKRKLARTIRQILDEAAGNA